MSAVGHRSGGWRAPSRVAPVATRRRRWHPRRGHQTPGPPPTATRSAAGSRNTAASPRGFAAPATTTIRGSSIDFPGGAGEDQLEHISWDEWFQKFDENNLAFLYQERKATGEDSTFFKLVKR
ncbi:MAG TPA: hypothetical protein VE570_04285 [Thermoleophilaceae bacterium]|nr:hypothetical protein [Thermoleophilaceae bacterium]